jgi:hypothetical protein
LKQLHISQKILNMASVLKIEDGAWHGLVEPGGEFPPEKGRYHLYIGRRALAQNASEADHLLQVSSARSHIVQTSSDF